MSSHSGTGCCRAEHTRVDVKSSWPGLLSWMSLSRCWVEGAQDERSRVDVEPSWPEQMSSCPCPVRFWVVQDHADFESFGLGLMSSHPGRCRVVRAWVMLSRPRLLLSWTGPSWGQVEQARAVVKLNEPETMSSRGGSGRCWAERARVDVELSGLRPMLFGTMPILSLLGLASCWVAWAQADVESFGLGSMSSRPGPLSSWTSQRRCRVERIRPMFSRAGLGRCRVVWTLADIESSITRPMSSGPGWGRFWVVQGHVDFEFFGLGLILSRLSPGRHRVVRARVDVKSSWLGLLSSWTDPSRCQVKRALVPWSLLSWMSPSRCGVEGAQAERALASVELSRPGPMSSRPGSGRFRVVRDHADFESFGLGLMSSRLCPGRWLGLGSMSS